MAKFYFEYMHEGGGTAGCTARVIEATDERDACWVFVAECQDSFYGGSPSFMGPLQAYEWVREQVKLKHRTVHGCFRVPEPIASSCDDGEIWTLYEASEVTTFFGDAPTVPLAQTEKVMRQRQQRIARAPERVVHSPGFGYLVHDAPVEQLRVTSEIAPVTQPEKNPPEDPPKTDQKTYYPRKLGL